eukprot:10668433-Ditylum_brightwellii.AAC.1
MKLQCLFVPYSTNRAYNKKIVEIQQQKVESPLKEWRAVHIQGLHPGLTRKDQLKLILHPSIAP